MFCCLIDISLFFCFVFCVGSLDKSVPEKLPPSLDATAEQPPLFDGTTKFVFSSFSFSVAVIDSSKNFVSNLVVVFVVSKVVYLLHLSICPSSLDHQEFQGLLSIHSVLCCHFPF